MVVSPTKSWFLETWSTGFSISQTHGDIWSIPTLFTFSPTIYSLLYSKKLSNQGHIFHPLTLRPVAHWDPNRRCFANVARPHVDLVKKIEVLSKPRKGGWPTLPPNGSVENGCISNRIVSFHLGSFSTEPWLWEKRYVGGTKKVLLMLQKSG